MTPLERKVAFRTKAMQDGKTLYAAAYEACGVTLYHLTEAIGNKRPVSDEVKQKFAAYIGVPVDEVFPPATVAA